MRPARTLVFGLIAACLALPALAGTEHSLRLTAFWSGEGRERLRGADASLTLAVPLAPAARVEGATLRLEGTHSIALLPRSQLGVRFNNATVGQVRLSPETTGFTLEADIPAELWRPGFNSLELFVAQHATESCEDPALPELWTELDLYRSRLAVRTARRYRQRLSDLDGLFHPGIGSETVARLVTVAGALDSAVGAEALPLAAQALALRRRYRPLAVTHRLAAAPDGGFPALYRTGDGGPEPASPRDGAAYLAPGQAGFHLLLGTREQLAPLLPPGYLGAGEGPGWRMDATPALSDAADTLVVPASQRLIVTGDTPAEVAAAARALTLTHDALNDSATVQLLAIDAPPTGERLPGAGALIPGEEYSFRQLGVDSLRLRGAGLHRQSVAVILPPDYYVSESADARLHLDFGYGAGVGPGSALNVTVNGQAVGGATFELANGQAFRRYQLVIPGRLLQGGRNEVVIEVALRAPLAGLPCSEVATDHLVGHLRDSSSITLPNATAAARQPDLALFANTAYPLAVPRRGEPVPLRIATAALADAALTLAGKLAQQAGVPLAHLRLELGGAEPAAPDMLLLAPAAALRGDLFEGLDAAVAATKRLPYRVQNIAYNRLARFLYGAGQRPLRVSGELTQESGLGGLAVLYAARNPLSEAEGTLLLLTAASTPLLRERIDGLVQPRLWGQLAGDFFAWSDSEDAELAMKVSPNYGLSDGDAPLLGLRLWLSHNPWYWLLAVLALVLLLSYVVYRMLRRRNEKLAQDWE